MRAFLFAALLAAGAAAAEPPAVAARFPPPARVPETPAFEPGRSAYTRDDELAALLGRLAAPPGVRRIEAGRSQQGRPIEALHFSRGPGRPAVLLVGQQHGDEPAGAEALLVVARQLAGGALAPVLERVDVVVLPRANPDGAAAGQRYTADGTDLNRDHLLLATPEARALSGLLQAFEPVLVADLHEFEAFADWQDKFGAVPRADLLLQAGTPPDGAPELARIAEEGFLRPLREALDARRLRHDTFHTNPPVPGDLRLAMGGPQPDTLRNVQTLRHGVGLLLESRGIGLGRAHLARRVDALAAAAGSVLASAAARADELRGLRRTLAERTVAAACRAPATVLAAQVPQTRELVLVDPATGADRVLPVLWLSSQPLRPVLVRPRPCGYWLAPAAADAARRLRALGLEVQSLKVARSVPGEAWRETARVTSGGRLRQLVAELQPRQLEMPAGSFHVPLAQPLAGLAIAALEPDAPGSYFAGRVLQGLDDAARVGVPLDTAAPAPAGAALSAPAGAALSPPAGTAQQ